MGSRRKLADLCEKIVDCPHSTPVWTDSGVIVLRSKNIRNGRLDLSNPSFTDEHHYQDRVRRAIPSEGDLVITREAPMGEVCMIPPGVRCCLGQRMVLLRPNNAKVDPRYLLFVLQSPQVQYEIHRHEGTGSTVSNLRIPALEALPIPTPPLPEQRAIAAVLGALDDKIELNRRMNGTLEAMARALFKSWFVDFDPVRAKMEGRPTGLPGEIEALFPGEMEEGRPRGWGVRPLDEILELAYGKALKESNRRPGAIPVFGSNGQVGWHDERLVEGPGIVVGRKGNPGIVTWSHTDFFPIDTTFYVVSKLGAPALHFLHYALQTHDLASLSADSAVPGLNRNIAYGNIQVVPPNDLIIKFEEYVAILFERIWICETESRTLSALRDALLPKLMSGEVRVKDHTFITGESK